MGYAFWNNYDASSAQFQLNETYSWIPQLGVSWSVSVDGISAPLVLLAGFVSGSQASLVLFPHAGSLFSADWGFRGSGYVAIFRYVGT